MPAKKNQLSESERAKRLREAARDLGTDETPESFEESFKKVVQTKPIKRSPQERP
jgi:hypothetical protein